MLGFVGYNDYNSSSGRNVLHSAKKNDISPSLEYIQECNQEKKENKWQKKTEMSNSTLSLHITAYENGIENQNFDHSSGKEFEQETFACKTLKNAFNFPRQFQESIKPEMMQFKTSQKLMNFNAIGKNKQLKMLGRLLQATTRSFLLGSRSISHTNVLFNGEYEWKDPKSEDEVVNITYITRDGTHKKIKGKVGDNAMYLAHRYDIEVEGACEASLACCTCHVYVDEEYFDKIPEPKEEEEDMLDLAPVLKPNSRLSCQIILKKDLEGMTLTLPRITRNFYVDGHVPEPH